HRHGEVRVERQGPGKIDLSVLMVVAAQILDPLPVGLVSRLRGGRDLSPIRGQVEGQHPPGDEEESDRDQCDGPAGFDTHPAHDTAGTPSGFRCSLPSRWRGAIPLGVTTNALTPASIVGTTLTPSASRIFGSSPSEPSKSTPPAAEARSDG